MPTESAATVQVVHSRKVLGVDDAQSLVPSGAAEHFESPQLAIRRNLSEQPEQQAKKRAALPSPDMRTKLPALLRTAAHQ
jgi:hypothetical protein